MLRIYGKGDTVSSNTDFWDGRTKNNMLYDFSGNEVSDVKSIVQFFKETIGQSIETLDFLERISQTELKGSGVYQNSLSNECIISSNDLVTVTIMGEQKRYVRLPPGICVHNQNVYIHKPAETLASKQLEQLLDLNREREEYAEIKYDFTTDSFKCKIAKKINTNEPAENFYFPSMEVWNDTTAGYTHSATLLAALVNHSTLGPFFIKDVGTNLTKINLENLVELTSNGTYYWVMTTTGNIELATSIGTSLMICSFINTDGTMSSINNTHTIYQHPAIVCTDLPEASLTECGIVNTDTQSFGGTKTFEDVTITGDLVVQGTTTSANQSTIEDSIFIINSGQTGTPPVGLLGGMEVERGDATNYRFVFRESDDSFVIGEIGSMQVVATREDSPATNNGIAIWNNTARRFDTTTVTISNGAISGTSFNSITALSSSEPLMNSTVAIGTSTTVARSDHVHPVDTSRAPVNHAVTATTYGVGSGTNYGHVKLYTTISNGVTDGAPDSNSVYDALALKANLASPTFTGTPTLPTGTIGVTQAVDTSGTSLATTAFVIGQACTNTPANLAETASIGTSLRFARGDHVHSANFSTDPLDIKMNGTQALGTNITLARSDHVHPSDTSRMATSHAANGITSTNITNWGSAYTHATNTTTTVHGATTVGYNLLHLANPTAIRFIRVNADNTVDTIDSDSLRSVINAGTVMSVSAGAGMDFATSTTYPTITMGAPSTLTSDTTNSASGTTHTHAVTTVPLGNADAGILRSNGATKAAGEIYSGTTDPTNTNRINYDGYFYATRFYGAFYGTASVASTVTLTADNSTNATDYPLFVNAATGNLSPRTDTGFTYNPSTGALTATLFNGTASNTTINPSFSGTYPIIVNVSNNTLYSIPTVTITGSTGAVAATSFNSITALSSTNPAMDGTVAIGTSTTVARSDHVHPSDTSRMATSHAANAITTTDITNWGSAYTNNHTHSNKENLDTINQNLSTSSQVSFLDLNINNNQGTFNGICRGGYYNGVNGIGIVVITIPYTPNIMLDMEISIQGYNSLGKYHIRGYTYTGSSNWHLVRATAICTGNAPYIVRYAINSINERVLLIGTTTTNWGDYMHVSIPRITVGYGTTISTPVISLVTSESGLSSITSVTVNDSFTATNVYCNGSSFPARGIQISSSAPSGGVHGDLWVVV